ncbi:MAG: transcription antitermination factor NusB [Planctomycetota bacterium]|nr:transcription antitermination factor NusB [Planctomycetota bacterium]
MPRRSKAREVVFQILYQDDLNPKVSPSVGEDLLARRLDNDELREFATDLLSGVRRKRPEIDQRLDGTADNWSVDRMAATDRNALRIGAYEILFADTPDPVAVDEAIELAKRYGTAQSAAFVNGILDRLMPGKEKAEHDTGEETRQAEETAEKPRTETLQQRAQRLKSRK